MNTPQLTITGRFFKCAEIREDELIDNAELPFANQIHREAARLGADYYRMPVNHPDDMAPANAVPVQDNRAVIDTRDADKWFASLDTAMRTKMRYAEKNGVEIQSRLLSTSFIHQIKAIYDETPVRQGRRFAHYGLDFYDVWWRANINRDHSHYIGAFKEDRMLAYIKFTVVNQVAHISQIIGLESERKLRAVSAAVAFAVRHCQAIGVKRLVYARYDYGVRSNDGLQEFKRQHGFTREDYYVYYVPLTLKGEIALALGLHLTWKRLLPAGLRDWAVAMRARLMRRAVA